MAKHFGTDGVRGVAGVDLTVALARSLGRAAGRALGARTAFLARDTRLSGPELERACGMGLAEVGLDVMHGAVLPSPAVSVLVRLQGYDLGVVISASHNPPQDNGIKLYDRQGQKLSPREEEAVESCLHAPLAARRRGRIGYVPDAEGIYRSFLRAAVPDLSLAGMRIVLDCAYGATTAVAPDVFRDLGADLVVLGAEPDGSRINETGAAALGLLLQVVQREKADLGIAFDGDGDRVVCVDDRGQVVEGDRMIAAIAPLVWSWREIRSQCVVFTVLANTGAERYLLDRGFRVLRVPVGDRNVSRAMREEGAELGGEPSGHIVFSRFVPTGDGILAALLVLRALRRTRASLAELVAPVPVYPQVREDVPVLDRDVAMASRDLRCALAEAERVLDGTGRTIVRPSGTQPLIRVLAEGPDEATLHEVVARIRQALDPFRIQASSDDPDRRF